VTVKCNCVSNQAEQASEQRLSDLLRVSNDVLSEYAQDLIDDIHGALWSHVHTENRQSVLQEELLR
jgi:hypothetical protein